MKIYTSIITLYSIVTTLILAFIFLQDRTEEKSETIVKIENISAVLASLGVVHTTESSLEGIFSTLSKFNEGIEVSSGQMKGEIFILKLPKRKQKTFAPYLRVQHDMRSPRLVINQKGIEYFGLPR